MEKYNYWERLEILDLYSMQRRRERYICMMMFNIYSGRLHNNLNLRFYNTPRHGVKCRRKTLTSRKQSINTIRCSAFADIGASLFNILPNSVKSAKTVGTFKSRLDKFLKLIPDQPPVPGYVRMNNNSIVDWMPHRSSSSLDLVLEDDETLLLEAVEQPGLPQPTLHN